MICNVGCCLTCKLPKSIGHVIIGPVAAIVIPIPENNFTHSFPQPASPLALKNYFLTMMGMMVIGDLVYVAVCISHHPPAFHCPLNPPSLIGVP